MNPAASSTSEVHTSPDWQRVGILEWRQPRMFERRWELRVDEALFATVWARGMFQRGFLAEIGHVRWEILVDWFGHVAIRREGETTPVARFQRGWFRTGRVTTAAGEEMRWRRGGLWVPEASLLNREDFLFFRIRRRFSPPRVQAGVELTDSGRRLEGLDHLLVLGWALMLNARHAHAH